MSSDKELQEEELEVLQSIYDGDENFKQLSPVVFQYKIGEDLNAKSFLLEVSWGETYPTDLPAINMDTFYNKHLTTGLKSHVVQTLTDQAEALLGMAMTYNLFEYAKENAELLFESQPEIETVQPNHEEERNEGVGEQSSSGSSKVKERKEQLTKSQKRKIVNRQDINGEMPRGWNWVDVVKHLCQTGRAGDTGDMT